MKKFNSVLLFFITSFFIVTLFTGCGEEDIVTNNPTIDSTGLNLYILNEGSSPGSGTLSLYRGENDSMYRSIYSGTLSYPDGLLLDGGYIYVLEQGAAFGGNGKIYKLTVNGTYVSESQPFGSSPYSLVVSNNKLFVTNGPSSSVTVLEKNSLNVIKTIQVGVYPQNILANGNMVYVCNTSAFGGSSDSTISVIDAVQDSLITTITLRKEPTSLFYSGGYLFSGCNSAGVIYKINPATNTKTDSFFVNSGFDKDISYGTQGNNLSFIDASNNISELDILNGNVTTLVTNPDPVNNFFYGYTYISKPYILDAKNFTVNGKLYVYSNSGVLEKSFTTGVAPRRSAFSISVISGAN